MMGASQVVKRHPRPQSGRRFPQVEETLLVEQFLLHVGVEHLELSVVLGHLRNELIDAHFL